MPVHGDHKRLHLHAQLAEAVGIDPDRVFEGENGLPLELDERGAAFGEPEQSGMIFVDGVDIGDPADVALRDRRMLSDDGIFIVVATISEQTGESVVDPEVIFRGVPFIEQADGLLARHPRRGRAVATARGRRRESGRSICSSRSCTTTSPTFVYDRLRRRPMVLPGRRRGVGPAVRLARRRRVARQRDHEPRPVEPSAVGSSSTEPPCDCGHGPDDRQAEPGPPPRPRGTAIAGAADEALEDPAAELVGDPGPVVLDHQQRVARC